MTAEEFVEAMDKGLARYSQATSETRQVVTDGRNKVAEQINLPSI
jgi:hypothetical protein